MDLPRIRITLAIPFLSLALAACDRGAPAPPPAAPAVAPASAPSGAPSTDIAPHTGDIPKSGATAGPAEGGAAIGGVTGGAQDSGAAKSAAPAPTGGDGAVAPEADRPKPK